MVKEMARHNRMIPRVVAVLGVLCLTLTSVAFADGGSESNSGNWLSNLASSVKNSVSELSAADTGGKPRIRPHFSTSTGYLFDSQLDTTRREGAWQARVAPGVALAVPVGDKLYTEVDYTYGFSTTQGEDNVHSNASNHNLNALARYDLSKDTVIGLSNNIQWSETPDKLNRTFMLETAQADISHRVTDKLRGNAGYTFQYYDDPSKDGTTSKEQDFSDNKFFSSLTYEVTEKLDLSPAFTWNNRSFRNVREKDFQQIQPGLLGTFELGPKTSLGANLGWAFRDFDKGGNESELVYGATVGHTFGRKVTWGVGYQKSIQDTFNTAFVNNANNPEATNLDTFDGNFRVVKAHRLDTNLTYNINEKNALNTFLGAQFVNTDAEDNVITGEKNDEKILETGFRYSYRITRYLSFDIGYTFGRRFTAQNSPGRTEYTLNKISGGLNLNF